MALHSKGNKMKHPQDHGKMNGFLKLAGAYHDLVIIFLILALQPHIRSDLKGVKHSLGVWRHTPEVPALGMLRKRGVPLGLAWTIPQVPNQPELHSKTVSKKGGGGGRAGALGWLSW